MSEQDELVFETALDAPPEKVWRALTVPEYLEHWLDTPEGTTVDRVAEEEFRSVTYRWSEPGIGEGAASEDSLVTFEVVPHEDGGTWFRLTHKVMQVPVAANSNAAGAQGLKLAA
jgi:uncharacterized protein YndB with AHSA1/START domain